MLGKGGMAAHSLPELTIDGWILESEDKVVQGEEDWLIPVVALSDVAVDRLFTGREGLDKQISGSNDSDAVAFAIVSSHHPNRRSDAGLVELSDPVYIRISEEMEQVEVADHCASL
ncbi:hypothetical protein LTR80_006174 [Exophiala xenobiotica]|nr:hypothetical protein LTS06_005918 [Exophiala xenobiotica]